MVLPSWFDSQYSTTLLLKRCGQKQPWGRPLIYEMYGNWSSSLRRLRHGLELYSHFFLGGFSRKYWRDDAHMVLPRPSLPFIWSINIRGGRGIDEKMEENIHSASCFAKSTRWTNCWKDEISVSALYDRTVGKATIPFAHQQLKFTLVYSGETYWCIPFCRALGNNSTTY